MGFLAHWHDMTQDNPANNVIFLSGAENLFQRISLNNMEKVVDPQIMGTLALEYVHQLKQIDWFLLWFGLIRLILN